MKKNNLDKDLLNTERLSDDFIKLMIENIKVFTINLIENLENTDNLRSLLDLNKIIIKLLLGFQEKINQTLKIKDVKKKSFLINNPEKNKEETLHIYDIFSNFSQKGQKTLLKKIYENIIKSDKYTIRKGTKEVGVLKKIILGNIELDEKSRKKLYMNLYFIFSNKDNTQRLQPETIKMLTNALLKDISLLDGIIDIKTGKLLCEIKDEKKEKKNKIKKKLKGIEQKENTSINTIVGDIYNLKIGQQQIFFKTFCKRLINLSSYNNITRQKKGNKIKSFSSILKGFLGGKSYHSFSSLFNGNKLGKTVIGKFIDKLLDTPYICSKIYNLSPLTKEKLELAIVEYKKNEEKLKNKKLEEEKPKENTKIYSNLNEKNRVKKQAPGINSYLDINSSKINIGTPAKETEPLKEEIEKETGLNLKESLSDEEYEELNNKGTNKNIFSVKIEIRDFLPVLQDKINKKVLEENPKAKLEDYEIFFEHFTIIFSNRGNTYIYPDLFKDRDKIVKGITKRKQFGKKGKKKAPNSKKN